METITCTTAEFAEILGVEYAVASGYLRFLVIRNIAKKVGERLSVKGKPASLYLIPKKVEIINAD